MASGLGLINYRVIDISANGELVGLLDEAGHNHVVRPDQIVMLNRMHPEAAADWLRA